MKGWARARFVARYHDPIVINHDIDVAALIMWFLYGSWGVATVLVNRSILETQFQYYPHVWGLSIGLLAWIGCVAVAIGFFTPLKLYPRRILIKKVEAYSIGLMCGFVVAYPVIMWVNALYPEISPENPPRIDLAIFALTYLVFPMWRVKHLLARMTQLRAIKKGLDEDE